jgi:hypothetical protein
MIIVMELIVGTPAWCAVEDDVRYWPKVAASILFF